MAGVHFLIDLGCKVRDRISGFTGIVVARSQHIHGCNRYGVQPPIDKDKKLPDCSWFDEPALDVLAAPQKPKVTGPGPG
jgi:hypothetical protein